MSLRRALGTRDVTFFAIACIIGTRWIPAAAHAGPGSILLWILGALCFAIPLSIAVAALTIRHPEAGGLYIWTRHDFGPFAGFLSFWLYWIGIVIWFASVWKESHQIAAAMGGGVTIIAIVAGIIPPVADLPRPVVALFLIVAIPVVDLTVRRWF